VLVLAVAHVAPPARCVQLLAEVAQKVLAAAGGRLGVAALAVRAFAPDVVGVSALTPTYSEALKIADTAKACGAKVVLGDDHAIFFSEMILRNRPQIDYVIANDGGEIPFVELVRALLDGSSMSEVSSLAYRHDGRVHLNPAPKYALSLRCATRFRIYPSSTTCSTSMPTITARSSATSTVTRCGR
jgi:radical SAM superfamily enzyme YgiQ (UPF0313 family)